MFRVSCLAALAIAVRTLAFAQGPTPPAPVRVDYRALPRPLVPADPLELVTGNAQPVQTAEQRLAAMTVLNKAFDLSNVRAQPYHLKTFVTASGGLPSDGTWLLEDISPGRGIYRWTAQGPNYNGINLYTDTTRGLVYSSQPGGVLPLRLLQARRAIFFNRAGVGPRTSMRTATSYLNGVEQTCVLTGGTFGGRVFTGARNWDEHEHCVDANTGLLTIYSPVPGLYIRYDYANAVKFHGKIIPSGFTITQAGRTVLEAKTQSVTDPPASNSPLFNPAGLTALGVGREMSPARAIAFIPLIHPVRLDGSSTNAVIQVVVLHGSVSPDGHLGEIEILASTDASLNQTALEHANKSHSGPIPYGTQPGTTPQSHEVLLTVEFVTAPPGTSP